MKINFNVPTELAEKIKFSKIYQNYTAAGKPSSFGIDLTLTQLDLSKSIRSRDIDLLVGKIEATIKAWHRQYQRHIDIQHKMSRSEEVDELNQQVAANREALNNILAHTLDIDDAVDWSSLKQGGGFVAEPKALFKDSQVPNFMEFDQAGCPKSFSKVPYTLEPVLESIKSKYSFFSKLVYGKKIQAEFDQAHADWSISCRNTDEENTQRTHKFKGARTKFDQMQAQFRLAQAQNNKAVERFKARYEDGSGEAIEEYSDLVLSNSQYPEYFPKSWILEYRKASRVLLIDYDLPSPTVLPTTLSFTYIKSRDAINEKKMSAAAHKILYDKVIYQICIRTIHELFEADVPGYIDMIVFNGLVTGTSEATGITETKTIISCSVNKEEFISFDLANVEPKATFKHLKGVSASNLSSLTPVPPVMQLEKTDKRFVEGREVVQNIDERTNLAAMHWGDFEHLVKELFEKEFAANGGEVKVTQASTDGGVDAIAFDPDPIRGGKIVIQAKRYTNTVGVAAVRDLYGTVMNEGATKGILVTTSDYGKDSYDFAKDKPLTLLSGSNLLSLLEEHGHQAKIDLTEAKKLSI